MATSQSTVDYIVDQLAPLGVVARKMFGEYALYVEGKVVALVCNDILYVKITEPGKMFVGKEYLEGFPYPGAKAAIRVAPEQLEDDEWLSELIQITAENLPLPKQKGALKNKASKK